MKIGDWVYSYSKGIWQVQWIKEVESVIPYKSKRELAFCKRFLNSKFKKSFQTELVSSSFLRKVLEFDEIQIENFIADNPGIYEKFREFEKPIDSILNFALYVDNEVVRNEFKKRMNAKFKLISSGFTDADIVNLLENELSDKRSSIRNFTIQFVSTNTEIENKKLIYRSFKILDF